MMIRVLIVDDDRMVAAANQVYLNSVSGFTCVGIAPNAEVAAKVLEATEVDLVLLDIFMPGKSGLDLLADIRQASHSVDVIVISAASDMHNIRTALRLGAVDYLIKPFAFDRFETAMRAYEQKHQWMNGPAEISQSQLDFFLHQERSDVSHRLPKGLTKETLQSVLTSIFEHESGTFTIEILANQVGISRVSIGKYLRFLADIGLVSMRPEYRSSGRPVYHYQLHANRVDVVKSLLE